MGNTNINKKSMGNANINKKWQEPLLKRINYIVKRFSI